MTATYDENLYTTRLCKESLTADQVARANRLAAEIANNPGDNRHLREERNQVRVGAGD